MKKIIFLITCVVLTSGCMQSSEHLIVFPDGTGTLEARVKMPKGTITLMDMMFGAMTQAMVQAFNPDAPQQEAKSMASQALTKKDLLDKAKKGGVHVEFLSFNREEASDGVYAHYKLKFDNLERFLESGLLSVKVDLFQDDERGWICETKEDKKSQELSGQKTQYDDFKNSKDFQSLDAMTQAMITSALENLQVEFIITLPFEITELSGEFETVNKNSARLFFSGDMFGDPEFIKRIEEMSQMISHVAWASDQPFPIDQGESLADISRIVFDSKSSPAAVNRRVVSGLGSSAAVGTNVRVLLKNGDNFDGRLVELTDEYVKLNIQGVAITYYREDIETIIQE